jgi:hypothetical protein
MRIMKKKTNRPSQTASKQGKFGLKWRADAIEERRGRDHERIGLVVEAKFPELEVVEFDQSVRGEGRDHGDDAKKKETRKERVFL